jgi:phytoene dehydrogenase-like protein
VVAVELSRRQVLELLLGAAALPACARTPVARDYPGQLRGASHAVGHRLRERAPLPAPVRTERAQVVIVGGGVAGLSCAWRLQKLGLAEVVVLELEDRAGGTAVSGQDGVCPHPWGAHYLPCPSAHDVELLELLRETGSVVGTTAAGQPVFEETHLVGTPKERVFVAGAWSEGLYPTVGASAQDLAELARFRREVAAWAARRGADGRPAFALPIDGSTTDPDVRALDGLSMAAWLDAQGYRSPRLRWLVEYGCRDDYGSELAYTSAWAGLHYFAARSSGEGDDGSDFLTWPEGNDFLVRHLAAGVRVRAASAVLAVRADEAAGEVELSTLDTRTGEAVAWRAAHVVLATPSFLRPFLVPDAPRWSPPTAPWLVANLHLRDRPRARGYPTAWDNVLYDSRSLGYVVATHQRHVARGPTVWTYYLPVLGADARAAREQVLSLDRRATVDAIVADLARAHVGLPELIERVDVWRWGHAMARPEVGWVWSEARQAAQRPWGRVHFAHSDLSCVGLFEEAFAHGNRAAREVHAALGG